MTFKAKKSPSERNAIVISFLYSSEKKLCKLSTLTFANYTETFSFRAQFRVSANGVRKRELCVFFRIFARRICIFEPCFFTWTVEPRLFRLNGIEEKHIMNSLKIISNCLQKFLVCIIMHIIFEYFLNVYLFLLFFDYLILEIFVKIT